MSPRERGQRPSEAAGGCIKPRCEEPTDPRLAARTQAPARPGPGFDRCGLVRWTMPQAVKGSRPLRAFTASPKGSHSREWDRHSETSWAHDLTHFTCSGPQERRARLARGSLLLTACCHAGQATVCSRGGLESSPQPSTAGSVRPARRPRVRRSQQPSQTQVLGLPRICTTRSPGGQGWQESLALPCGQRTGPCSCWVSGEKPPRRESASCSRRPGFGCRLCDSGDVPQPL